MKQDVTEIKRRQKFWRGGSKRLVLVYVFDICVGAEFFRVSFVRVGMIHIIVLLVVGMTGWGTIRRVLHRVSGEGESCGCKLLTR